MVPYLTVTTRICYCTANPPLIFVEVKCFDTQPFLYKEDHLMSMEKSLELTQVHTVHKAPGLVCQKHGSSLALLLKSGPYVGQ